jgi:hypothetical protein
LAALSIRLERMKPKFQAEPHILTSSPFATPSLRLRLR